MEKTYRYKRGTITGLDADGRSGLIVLYLNKRRFYGENGPLCRALDDVFPGFINYSEHAVDPSVVVGRRVVVALDKVGVIAGIADDNGDDGFATEA